MASKADKQTEEMIGTVKIYDEDFIFNYKDRKLSVYLDSDETIFRLTSRKDENNAITIEQRPLQIDHLDGKLAENKRSIRFYFDPSNYGWQVSHNEHGSPSVLSIFINKFLLFEGKNLLPGPGSLTLYSKQFHHFLSMIPRIRASEDSEWKYIADYHFLSTKMTSNFLLDGKKILIHPTFKVGDLISSLDFTPGLLVKFEDLDIPKMLSLCDCLFSFLKFAFMRRDIFPDEIVFSAEGDIGHIHYPPFQPGEYESEDLKIYGKYECLPWELLYKKAGNIISLIHDDSLRFPNIPENRMDRYIVSMNDITQIPAAFDAEFAINYPKFVSPILTKRGKTKKATLAERIERALLDNGDALKAIKKKTGITISDQTIASKCASFRNAVDHGDKLPNDKRDVAESFRMLNCLVYALQLKRAGYDPDEIDALLPRLYFR